MQLVLTLIAGGEGGLTEDTPGRVADIAENLTDSKASAPDWLAPGIACDIGLEGDDLYGLRQSLHVELRQERFDSVLQPAEGRRKALLLADMDSTIVTSETLDELAGLCGNQGPDRGYHRTRHAGRDRFPGRAARARLDAERAVRRCAGPHPRGSN